MVDTQRILVISSVGTPTPPGKMLDGKWQPAYGGLEAVAAWSAQELARRGHAVTLVCSIDSPHKMLKEQGVKTLPSVFSNMTPIPEVEHWGVMKARLKNPEFDWVLDDSHVCVSTALQKEHGDKVGVCLRRLHDAQSFGSPPPVEYPCFVTPSRGVGENIAARHSWFYYRVCNHGLPIEDYKPGSGGDRLAVLARVQSLKGIDVAIEVAEATGRGLDIIGPITHIQGDPYLRSIQKRADGEHIIVHGEVTQERKVELLGQAYAILAPSRFAEPFNLASIESQACGTPSIVSANGGLPETVKHGVSGFVAWDFTDFVEYVELAGKLSRADCRAWAEKFSIKAMVDRLLKLREDAIEHPW